MADSSKSVESPDPKDTKSLPRWERLRKERRLGIVPVDISVMAQHLLTPANHGVTVTGLPIDAVYITSFYNQMSQDLQMVYAHESFEPVTEGTNLPILNVYYTEYKGIDLRLDSPDASKGQE